MGFQVFWFVDMFPSIMLHSLAASVCACGFDQAHRLCNDHHGDILSMHPSAKIVRIRTVFAEANSRGQNCG